MQFLNQTQSPKLPKDSNLFFADSQHHFMRIKLDIIFLEHYAVSHLDKPSIPNNYTVSATRCAVSC